jgi:hypothetical protein
MMYDMLLLISSMKQVKDHVPKYILLHGKKKEFPSYFLRKLKSLGRRIQQQLNVKCYVHQAKML